MKARIGIGTLTLLAALAAPVQAQDLRPGIAVLPFENGGSYGRDREDFDALRRGLAAMLISELSQSPQVRLVDRWATQELIGEQAMTRAGSVDASTAVKLGKLVGAKYMIAGTFIDLYGDFRADARIISVESGEILKVVKGDPTLKDRRQMYQIVQSLAMAILADTHIAANFTPAAREVPSEALTLYSRAVLYEDKGDRPHAIEYYKKALSAFPAYAEAQDGLRKIEARP